MKGRGRERKKERERERARKQERALGTEGKRARERLRERDRVRKREIVRERARERARERREMEREGSKETQGRALLTRCAPLLQPTEEAISLNHTAFSMRTPSMLPIDRPSVGGNRKAKDGGKEGGKRDEAVR